MSFHIPPVDHPARSMFDMEHIVEVLNPSNLAKLPSVYEAVSSAGKSFAANKSAIKMSRIVYVVIRGDDERWLISIGPRGGWRKEWNFGKNN